MAWILLRSHMWPASKITIAFSLFRGFLAQLRSTAASLPIPPIGLIALNQDEVRREARYEHLRDFSNAGTRFEILSLSGYYQPLTFAVLNGETPSLKAHLVDPRSLPLAEAIVKSDSSTRIGKLPAVPLEINWIRFRYLG
ncbi:hypothetical protein N7535_001383, partial [Penicillium sp. DV-2018c]